MERLGPIFRMSLGLVVLTSSLIVLADVVGLVPDPGNAVLESRILLTETLAGQLVPAAKKHDLRSIREILDIAVARNEAMLSAGLRAVGGQLMVRSGDHRSLWQPESPTHSSPTHVRIPLFRAGREWAVVELRFRGGESSNVLVALWERPLVRLVLAMAIVGFVVYMLYMRRTLRHLDPSAVVPARVQTALDVMAEGVVLLDDHERIVLVNIAFAEMLDRTPASLRGTKASTLDWKSGREGAPLELPWFDSIRDGESSKGTSLRIETAPGSFLSLAVNASPVLDGWERPKGAIVTFDDVTLLEHKTAALESAYIELEKSRDEIQLHAQEMEVLAKRDPLTGVANRRAFMEWAETGLTDARTKGSEFCLLMADIDHFKRINDTHGHPAGDDVIRRVGLLFADSVRSADAVCRYGGEEFCIALPSAPLDVARQVAERLREQIAAPGFAEVPLTMSFGVASSRSGAGSLSELIDQSDKALYASKEGGRNRTTCWQDTADQA